MQFRGLTLCLSAMLLSVSVSAAPMPNSIVVKDNAIVPILKTEVIRTVTGEKPIRHVEATIFEVSNQGKDIVAKEVVFDDDIFFSASSLCCWPPFYLPGCCWRGWH